MQNRASFQTIPDREQVAFRNWFGCSNLALFLYTGFCVALATATYFRPLPTFDRYLYAGAVASLRYSDPVTIHRIARAEFDAQPSPFPFESVAAEPYFADVRDNPYHFAQQLGLFRVKLGYVAAGYVLWRAGLPILAGLRLISACCLFLVGMVVLASTGDALLAAVLLLTPPVLNLGRMVTADPSVNGDGFVALFALDKKRDLLASHSSRGQHSGEIRQRCSRSHSSGMDGLEAEHIRLLLEPCTLRLPLFWALVNRIAGFSAGGSHAARLRQAGN